MSIIALVFVLITIGVLLWLVNTLIPLEPKIRTIINVVVVLVVILWLLKVFHLLDLGPKI